MWQKIYSKLQEHGLNPYPPGKHVGECKERYCVIKEQTQSAYFNARAVGYRAYDLILFVPWSSYVAIGPYVQVVKEAMRELPALRYTGTETPVIVEDEKKAYSTSLVYQAMKRLEG